MKRVLIAASALIVATAPAFAGGWSMDVSNSAAVNLAAQVASIKSGFNKGKIKQVTGAAAESFNKRDCHCEGLQVSNAAAKNVSVQVGKVKSIVNVGTISQSAVSTAHASNNRY